MSDVYDDDPSIQTATLPAKVEKHADHLTPAQAKVDAVAALTMKVYERASQLDLTPEECEKLQADFPDDAFRPGAAGKENLIYIEHASLRDRLNEVFRPGQWSIIPRNRWNEVNGNGITVYVEAMLVIRGCFVAEAVGDMTFYPHNNATNIGDAIEGAKTQALRRCAKELGIGLQAWKKGWCEGWWARKGKAPAQEQAGNADATRTKAPDCPKCGKMGRESKDRPGEFYCWKKKEGCGHIWTPKPASGKPDPVDQAIVDAWKAKLDPDTVNCERLNAMLPELKAAPINNLTMLAIFKEMKIFAKQWELEWSDESKKFHEKANSTF